VGRFVLQQDKKGGGKKSHATVFFFVLKFCVKVNGNHKIGPRTW